MTVDWWQKSVWRQSWSVARVGSLLMLIPLAATMGFQKWQQAEQRLSFCGRHLSEAVFAPAQNTMIAVGVDTRPTGQNCFIAAWDTTSGRKLWQKSLLGKASELSVSPDAQRFLAINQDTAQVEVRNVATGQLLQTVNGMETSSEHEIHHFSLDTLADEPYPRYRAAWISKGKEIVVGGPGHLNIQPYHSADSVVRLNLPNPGTSVDQIESLADPSAFLTTTQSGTVVQTRDSRNGSVLRTLQWGKGLVASVLPDGKRVAVLNRDREHITLYDAVSGEKLAVVRFKTGYSSQFKVVESAEGPGYMDILVQNPPQNSPERLIMNPQRPKPRLYRYRWQLKTGRVRPVLALPLEKGCFAFSNTGRLLVSLHQGNGEQHPPLAIQHDPQSGTMIGRIEGNAGW